METQATDAENAAFVVFVVVVTRVILAFDLNLYIPLSKVDDNMKREHERDGVHQRKVCIQGGGTICRRKLQYAGGRYNM